MNEKNPIRWRDPGSEVPDGVREVMGSAALDEVDAARLGRFVDRVEAAIAGSVAPSPARALLSGKVVAGVAVLVGGAVLTWMLWEKPVADRQARRLPADEATVPVRATPPPVPATSSVRATPARVIETAQTVPSAPRAPIETPHVSAGPRQATSPADSLAEEVRLLQGAREAMGGDPAGALRLAEQHRTRFPRGTLAQEREVIAIDALVHQGRTVEAQERAERFRARYPRSSHLDRLPILRDNRD